MSRCEEFRPLHVHSALESKVYDHVLKRLDQIEQETHKLVEMALSYFDDFKNFVDLRNTSSFNHCGQETIQDSGNADADEATHIRAEHGEHMLARFMEVLRQPNTYKTEVACTFTAHQAHSLDSE